MRTLRIILSTLILSASMTGCITTLGRTAHPKMPQYPTLETIEVEGHVIYYRDLSDPCDPNSTAWNNLNKPKHKGRRPENCSTPVARIPNPLPVVEVPEKDYVLMFVMSKRKLSETNSSNLVEELAAMGEWPVRYQIYGAAGGVGPKLERLGLNRAEVVRETLIAAGVSDSKIDIMPYDPTIPGLRAVVRLVGQGA